MKKYRKEDAFLDELRRIPNVTIACEKIGISRNTVYRWSKEDPYFKKRKEEAIFMGEDSINDLAQSNIIKKLKEGDFAASKYWLNSHNPNFFRPIIRDYIRRKYGNFTKDNTIVQDILFGAGFANGSGNKIPDDKEK